MVNWTGGAASGANSGAGVRVDTATTRGGRVRLPVGGSACFRCGGPMHATFSIGNR